MPKPKTKEELKNDILQKQIQKFIEEYDKLTHDLAVKYGYQLIPIIQYSPDGIKPALDLAKVKHKLDAKTDTPAD